MTGSCPFGWSAPQKENGVEVRYFWPSYYISRFNFVAVHLFTVFYWFPFLFGNPFNFPWVISTVASRSSPASRQCVIDYDAAKTNTLLWLFVWWGPHSTLARRVVKQALGLWEHPLDRPLFGVVACLGITTWTLLWRPIDNCSSFDAFAVSSLQWAIAVPILAFALFLILGFFWTMPDHVFGTSRHRVVANPPKHKLFTRFPYGMVRHPAASGFIYIFWAFAFLSNWNVNYLFYAALWSIFIVVGTHFEEGGLRSARGEFGKDYLRYASQVGMFFPKLRWFRGEPVKV